MNKKIHIHFMKNFLMMIVIRYQDDYELDPENHLYEDGT